MENNKLNVTEVYKESGIAMYIPLKYTAVYKAIIILFSELGEDMLKDCNSFCKNKNKNIIECYTLFECALSAHNNNNFKLADLIINYLKKELNIMANLNKNKLSCTFPLDNKGNINLFIEYENDNTQEVYIDKQLVNYIKNNITENLEETFITKDNINKLIKEVKDINYIITNKKTTLDFNGQKVQKGTTELYINGIRYWNEGPDGDDYQEILNVDNQVIAIKLLSDGIFEESDEINIKGVIIN